MISVRNPPKEKAWNFSYHQEISGFFVLKLTIYWSMGFIVGIIFRITSQCFVMLYYHGFVWFPNIRDPSWLSSNHSLIAVILLSVVNFCCQKKYSVRALLRWLKNIQCCSQSFKRFLFFLFGCFGINVHRSLDVFMPHNRLDNLQVGLFFAKPCTECVTQIVCRKVWKQNRITVLFLWCHFFARIVICNDSLDSTIYRFSSLHDNSILIVKQKVKFRICPSEFSNVQFMALITEYERILDSVQKSHSLPKQPCQFCKQL